MRLVYKQLEGLVLPLGSRKEEVGTKSAIRLVSAVGNAVHLQIGSAPLLNDHSPLSSPVLAHNSPWYRFGSGCWFGSRDSHPRFDYVEDSVDVVICATVSACPGRARPLCTIELDNLKRDWNFPEFCFVFSGMVIVTYIRSFVVCSQSNPWNAIVKAASMVIPKSYLLGSTLTKWDVNRKHLIVVVSEILEKKKTSKVRHLALIVVAFFCAYMTKKRGGTRRPRFLFGTGGQLSFEGCAKESIWFKTIFPGHRLFKNTI